MGTNDLPTARDAMMRAIRSGNSGNMEIARFWLDIARELRKGSMPAPAGTFTATQTDTMALRRPDERPGETDVTAVMNGLRCVHCGYYVHERDGRLVHVRTDQEVCPVPLVADDQTVVHTYAALDDGAQVG